jgi:hypothetical protein
VTTDLTSATIRIYGASDNLIEARGTVYDECNPSMDKPALIRVTATTDAGQPVEVVLTAEFDPDGTGEWRISEIDGYGLVTIIHARGDGEPADADGCPGHSDKATIRGGYRIEVEGLTWAYDPKVLSWDWKAQPDLDALADLLEPHGVTLTKIDTGSDEVAIRISATEAR